MSMSLVRMLLKRLLYGGTSKLRTVESACIEAWSGRLSTEGAAVLKRQLSRFDLIQRSPDGRVVTFFDTNEDGHLTWKNEDLFVLRVEEVSVARVWLGTKEYPQVEIKVDVVLHRGRLSSLEFNKSPKAFRDRLTVTKVKTLVDPMLHCEVPVPISLTDIAGDFQEFLLRINATNLHKPLSRLLIDEFARTIDAKIPTDYMKLAEVTDGVTIESWRIHGLQQLRRISQPTGNYYLLAEATDGRAIAILQEDEDMQLYIVDPEDDSPKSVNQSLLDYIERDLANSVRTTSNLDN